MIPAGFCLIFTKIIFRKETKGKDSGGIGQIRQDFSSEKG